jgi:DNA (cytosine-5)-methyltransferase 1
MPIPVIDLFAGPGGLGEGFSSLLNLNGERAFKIKLSIEMEEHAHQTLQLRAFFRNFPHGRAPEAYYDYLRGKLSRDDLFQKFPGEAAAASEEAWHATLGSTHLPKRKIDERISTALASARNWVLIGGPPCQAYSLVGRSRVIGGKDGMRKYEADPKHRLYRHYLRVIAIHRPPVFVMENVKGLLSAKVKEEPIFARILKDLARPAVAGQVECDAPDLEYKLVSLVQRTDADHHEPEEFVVCSEEYGIPQARHRIIILGIRSDIVRQQNLLERRAKTTVAQAIEQFAKSSRTEAGLPTSETIASARRVSPSSR